MFDALALEVKEVTNLDLQSLGDDEMSEAVVEVARLRSALEAGEARLAKAWDDRRAWAADGAKAGRAWLARRTREAKSDCGRRLWLGREVGDMPLVGEAWLAGAISATHVRRLAKARNRRSEEAFVESESMLVNLATTLTFAHFAQALDYWMLHADPDGAEESDMERHNRRRASCDETLSGMFSGMFLLDAIGGTVVSNELARLEAKLFESDWAEAKQRLGRDPLIFELSRTPEQRRADSLVAMASRSAGNVEDKKAKPLFTLLLGSETERAVRARSAPHRLSRSEPDRRPRHERSRRRSAARCLPPTGPPAGPSSGPGPTRIAHQGGRSGLLEALRRSAVVGYQGISASRSWRERCSLPLGGQRVGVRRAELHHWAS